MKYRSGTGFWAFILHRGSGVLLALFILPHLYMLYFLKDPSRYEAIRSFFFYARPAVRLTGVGVLALVLAHGLNGIRVMLLEAGTPSRFQKALFRAAVLLGLLLLFAGARLMMR
ncbi:MAG: hypothetical protein M0Z75_08385 [Nitrospiraceae bacterium]|nr:hypothetical protein [Nitrospiraceae bacterium]MDA8091621.1 hypothetical protein [Nitrospiraceae bacterium]